MCNDEGVAVGGANKFDRMIGRATKFDRMGSIPGRVIPKTGPCAKVPLTHPVLLHEASRVVPVASKPRGGHRPLVTLPKGEQ